MANSYFQILPSQIIADIATALTTKYGAGVTIRTQTTTDLIFTCSAISNKVIRIYETGKRISFGDAWTSGTTITNPVLFCDSRSALLSTETSHLVLGDSFLVWFFKTGTYDPGGRNLPYIGYTSGGVPVACAFSQDAVAVTSVTSYSYELSTNKLIFPIGLTETFNDASGKIMKTPLLFRFEDGMLMTKIDGTPDSLTGLHVSSSMLKDIKGANFMLSHNPIGVKNQPNLLRTSLIVEW